MALHMDTTKTRRRMFGLALALCLVAGGASPARAGLWSGACALRVAITFDTPVRPPVASTSYTIEAIGAVDLDVLTPGLQSCAFTLTGSPAGATGAIGHGSALVWSCAETVALGSWHQSFEAEGPPAFSGTHVLTGSWGAWTLHVQTPALNVLGVGELTLDPSAATRTVGCGVGSIESVTMVGTLVFQDP